MNIKTKLLSVVATLIFVQSQAFGGDSAGRLQYEIVAVLDMSKHELSARAHLTIPMYALATPDEIHLGARSAGNDKEGKPL